MSTKTKPPVKEVTRPVGRPLKAAGTRVYKTTVQFTATQEMAQFIHAEGGPGFLRKLVESYQKAKIKAESKKFDKDAKPAVS